MTCIDGYLLKKRRRGIAAVGSWISRTIGLLVLTLVTALATSLAVRTAEYTACSSSA
jgi:hypothetical protein